MIGSAVVDRLVRGRAVAVWDPSADAVQRAVAAGAVAVDQLSGLVDTPVVLMALPGPDQVRTVVTEIVDAARSTGVGPRVMVDLSTVDPTTSVGLAALTAEVGIGYLDAPILGRPDRCGRWTLPVGGPEAALELARPVLTELAARIVAVGDSGRGNIVKLLNNLMLGAINAITVETMVAAQRLGLDRGVYADTLAQSGAASVSGLFTELAPKIIAGDVSPTFSIDLLAKDNRLALAMVEATGLHLELASTPRPAEPRRAGSRARCAGHQRDGPAGRDGGRRWVGCARGTTVTPTPVPSPTEG